MKRKSTIISRAGQDSYFICGIERKFNEISQMIYMALIMAAFKLSKHYCEPMRHNNRHRFTTEEAQVCLEKSIGECRRVFGDKTPMCEQYLQTIQHMAIGGDIEVPLLLDRYTKS